MVTRRVTSRVTAPTARRVTGNGVSGVSAGFKTAVFINNTGQSNSHGTVGTGSEGITTTQENNAFGLAKDKNVSPLIWGLRPLRVEYFGRNDPINSWKTENPIFGAMGFLYQLLSEENGKSFNDYKEIFIGSNNGQAGATIAQLEKGGTTGKFEDAIGQAAALKAISDNASIQSLFGMTMWLQGESEAGNTGYKADLTALVDDYKTDGKAATGQTTDPIFVTWQLSHSASFPNIAPAQLELANERSDVYCSGPTYFLPRLDGVHFTPTGYKWLGAYFGLVYKRAVIDGVGFEPLQPSSTSITGDSIDITFNKSGLVFDTAGDLPEQTDYGFSVEEADTTAVIIDSISIVGGNTVRLNCASTPQTGWVVKYGHEDMVGITEWTYSGPGGNLRDSQGDSLSYTLISKPLHNWCCLFEVTL